MAGKAVRAQSAQYNNFENLILFAPAIILLLITQNDGWAQPILAIIHVILRFLYIIAYIYGNSQKKSYIRSIIYMIALGITIGFYIKAMINDI